MGVVGLTVPEPDGGLGLGLVDLVGLLEEAGRACLPEPLAETTGLVVPLLADVGSFASGDADRAGPQRDVAAAAVAAPAVAGADVAPADVAPAAVAGADVAPADVAPADVAADLAHHWMRRVAQGSAIATIGVVAPRSSDTSRAPDGRASVVCGANADLVVVASPERVVALEAGDASPEPADSIDPTRRPALMSYPSGAGTTLAVGEQAAELTSRLADRGALCTAAVLLGVADRLIAFARDHALERHQFGRPIGSFQAVKHMLADAYIALEMARPTVYKAAWSLDAVVTTTSTAGTAGGETTAGTASRDCSMAKAVTSEAALQAARVALQVHGAIGYTWEHDLHMWLKRAWVLAASWGGVATHSDAVLRSVTGRAGRTG